MKLFAALLGMLIAVPALADGTLRIEPQRQTVQVGQTFDIELWVGESQPFNGVETSIPFDTSLVEYVTMPREFTEGPYLRDAVAGRLCGSGQVGGFTFYTLRAETTWVWAGDIIMCADLSVTGPGMVGRHRFLAKAPGVQRFDYANGLCCWGQPPRYVGYSVLYDAGLYVLPMHYEGAEVTILGTDVLDAGPAQIRFSVRSERGVAFFRGNGVVKVYDIAGRFVTGMEVNGEASWANGKPGVYVAKMGEESRRFAIIR